MKFNELDFDNAAAMLLSVHAAIDVTVQHDTPLADIITSRDVSFLIGFGQATSASAYAAFDKISKELAYTTINRWLMMYQNDINALLEFVDEVRTNGKEKATK